MNENEFSDEEDEESGDVELAETASAFTLLENEYKLMLTKIQENEDMRDFGEAYTKLFEAFYQTYSNEQDLLTKTSELEKQLTETIEELESYKKTTECDALIINDLKDQLTLSREYTDKAHAREQQAQEVIENMRNQVVKLNTELELKSRLGGEEDDEMGALNKTKEGFEREKQRMIDEIANLKQKLSNALSYSEELEHKNSAADLKAAELNSLLEQQTSESSKKQRQIEKLEGELATQQKNLEDMQRNLDTANETIDTSARQISLLESQLRDQKTAAERANKNAEMIQLKLDKCQSDHDQLHAELSDLKEKFADQTKFFRLKCDECRHLQNDLTKLNKQRENCEKKVVGLERIKFSIEQDREKLRTTVGVMEREIIIGKKQTDSDRKQIDTLVKEKEILHKNIMRIQGVVEEHLKLIKIQEQSKRKLEGDIHNIKADIAAQRKVIDKLTKERNRAMEETLDLTQQVEDAMDEIKLKQQSIYEYKKIIAEMETKLRQQQNLFEAVRADRNAFQKQLQEATAEMSEIKSKLKISIHQNEQLKEDISAKESLLLKEENVLRKLNKEKENLKIEVQTGLNTIHKLKHEISELQQTEKNLTKFIQDHEATIRKQAKELEQIMNDRDVIGAQLVRRNDELGLLYEKINILEITLHRGEAQYDQRIEDIRLLKLEVRRLRQEKNYLSKSIANMTDLKHEVFTLERELAQERLKCRALEEELQHPMNIHRWRKLEGSDPHVVDLLQKIQLLQKRLLNQTSESIEREKQLKESERLYLNLRQILARQPGPDIKNELIKTQRALAIRGSKMKCLVSELNMYETQAMEYKMDLEKVSKELKDVKKKYFKNKKLNATQQAAETKLPAIKMDEETHMKFTGGGYKMGP